MELAIQEALYGLQQNEIPVGAVLVRNGEVLAKNHNRCVTDNDPTAHAEILALREGASRVGNFRLEGCELYVTLEPCPMCAGAIVHSRLKRLIFGAPCDKTGAVETVFRLLNDPRLNHQVQVTGGVLAEQCKELLQVFFQVRREGGEVPKWS